MQLLVISSPGPVRNEAGIVNALFDAGLERFHLRKPDSKREEIMTFIKSIKPEFHAKIVLHQHDELAETFKIKGIHFSESKRLQASDAELKQRKEKGLTLSTSVHAMADYQLLPRWFDYAFYGPVFESISKPGYKPVSGHVADTSQKNAHTKLIAIGGITAGNMEEVKKTGFDGAALLGTLWSDPENAVTVFKTCFEKSN